MSRDLAKATTEYSAAARELGDVVRVRLQRLAPRAEAEAKGNATSRPKVRSGALRRSIHGRADVDLLGASLTLTAGEDGTSTGRYASLQEYGGVVRAIRSRYLAIPVGPARTAAGASRYTSPRDVAGLSWHPGREGGMLGKVTGKGKSARFEPWFLLRREVRVPETRFIGRALEWARQQAPQALSGVLQDGVGARHAG